MDGNGIYFSLSEFTLWTFSDLIYEFGIIKSAHIIKFDDILGQGVPPHRDVLAPSTNIWGIHQPTQIILKLVLLIYIDDHIRWQAHVNKKW